MKASWPRITLPRNWTVKDVERQMPPEIRRVRRSHVVTIKLTPGPDVHDPELERTFFASLNMDEKDALEAQYQALVDTGLVERFALRFEPQRDFGMCTSIGRLVEATRL